MDISLRMDGYGLDGVDGYTPPTLLEHTHCFIDLIISFR